MNYNETETLKEVVDTATELKNWLVNYVGEKSDPENGEVTVAMIVETMAVEFPEFLMAVAEENWIRVRRCLRTLLLSKCRRKLPRIRT